MRGLILKIFVSYWIAATIVIVIFNIVGSPMHRPEYSRAMETLLAITASDVAAEYESSGCHLESTIPDLSQTRFYLAKPTGEPLCGTPRDDGIKNLIARAASSSAFARKRNMDDEYFAVATRSPSGKPYVLLMQEPYAQPGKIFGLLTPSYTTVGISGVCTLLLAILLTRPIHRLRVAARQIASGKLDTRVKWNRSNSANAKRVSGLDGLVQDFNYMADRLQTLVSSQRILLRDVSHEIRSPLARLTVALELVRERPDEERLKHLGRIEREAGLINKMLGELLSLSHLDTIDSITEPEDIRLNEMLLELSTDAAYEAQQVNKHVCCRLDETCSILGNTLVLRRGFENVIRNAVHYCPEGGLINIELNTELRNASHFAVIRVSDSGPGVPEHELELILQPFYRASRAQGRPTSGFGLGLSIAARSIQLHSGTITARNQASGGLLVEITVPIA